MSLSSGARAPGGRRPPQAWWGDYVGANLAFRSRQIKARAGGEGRTCDSGAEAKGSSYCSVSAAVMKCPTHATPTDRPRLLGRPCVLLNAQLPAQVLATAEDGSQYPVCCFVRPLQLGRELGSAREAARWVRPALRCTSPHTWRVQRPPPRLLAAHMRAALAHPWFMTHECVMPFASQVSLLARREDTAPLPGGGSGELSDAWCLLHTVLTVGTASKVGSTKGTREAGREGRRELHRGACGAARCCERQGRLRTEYSHGRHDSKKRKLGASIQFDLVPKHAPGGGMGGSVPGLGKLLKQRVTMYVLGQTA
jgi:hypothetical protein